MVVPDRDPWTHKKCSLKRRSLKNNRSIHVHVYPIIDDPRSKYRCIQTVRSKNRWHLLKTTGITRYAPNFSDMLFMIMASPRGFSDFILKAEKYAKKLSKNDHFCTQRCLPISRVRIINIEIPSATSFLFNRVTIQNLFGQRPR